MGMTNEKREKHIRIANMLIELINDVQMPMLLYQIEKDVAKEALENYIKMLEQQSFINKPCVSEGVCREDKIQVLDKIRAEIEAIIGERNLNDYDFCSGLICARKILDKYRAESEE